MMKVCLNMKIKTLVMMTGLSLLLGFVLILYATSTAPKVHPRDTTAEPQQQNNRKKETVREQMVDNAKLKGGDDRVVEPVDNGIPVIVQSVNRHLNDGHEFLEPLPADSTVLTTEELPSDVRLRPGIGNGHVATVVYSDSIYMNGLYNGFQSQSHRARIPAFCALQISAVHPTADFKRSYTLNMSTGIFTETLTGSYFTVYHQMYAHREIKELIVSEIKLSRSNIEKPFGISLKINHGEDSEDVDFQEGQTLIAGSKYVFGKIKTPELNGSIHDEVHVYYTEITTNLSLTPSMSETTYIILTSISNTKKKAEDSYDTGSKLFQVKSLTYKHTSSWAKLWMEGRMDIDGNNELAQLAYSSLYYLLSCLPSNEDDQLPFTGLSPEGLDHGSAKQAYWGHVMWDQESWQYPPLLMLYPNLASIILTSRTRTLQAAKTQAKLRGFQGAMYPWESAKTGGDVTVSKDCSKYEQHITGDIALAIQNYLYMTHDVKFLKEKSGAEVITAIAEFWASRVKKDVKTGKYQILGVMPPDESHSPVNNSVYTNSVAGLSLMLPSYALPLIGQTPPPEFREIAENLYKPFDSTLKYHPEFDGYKAGTKVKQADVILLGFPLMLEPDLKVRKNDLVIYAEASDPDGPAMTWQMFTIGWLELKDTPRATENLYRSIKHVKGPFKVWTEFQDGTGAVNFRTGMGGFLQALIFGYGGFRILNDGLYLDPTLPPSSTKFTITSLDYLGNSLDFVFTQKTTDITVTKLGVPLMLTIPGLSTHYSLTPGKTLTISKHKAVIKLDTR